MNDLISKYKGEEFFDNYYANGLFHPTECQELYAHKDLKEKEDCLVIGEVYDDHNLLICYRLNYPGIWGRLKSDGSFQKIADTLKEFTIGWYQERSNYWGSMKSNTQLKEIIQFYKINLFRYHWNSQVYIHLLEEIINQNLESNLFAKGYKSCLDLTSTNGFVGRAKTNMVTVCFNEAQRKYELYLKENFFDYDVPSKDFSEDQVSEIIESIINWINRNSK